MSRTKELNQRTGEEFPRKSLKKWKDKKYFGHREGDDKKPHAKKNVDFMNYGYPMELRHRSVIKNKILNQISKEELEKIKDLL
jgi:hypothetical protein